MKEIRHTESAILQRESERHFDNNRIIMSSNAGLKVNVSGKQSVGTLQKARASPSNKEKLLCNRKKRWVGPGSYWEGTLLRDIHHWNRQRSWSLFILYFRGSDVMLRNIKTRRDDNMGNKALPDTSRYEESRWWISPLCHFSTQSSKLACVILCDNELCLTRS